ncbi:MAG: hypothetical protein ACSHX8_00285 [Opitutaceae bacterium]
MLKTSSDVKFKAGTRETTSSDSIEFLISISVTDKSAKESFQKAEQVYTSLKTSISGVSIKGIELQLFEPEASSEKSRFFRLAHDPGLKRKISVSIDLLVKVTLEPNLGFWGKGSAISELVDFFENISEVWSREKEVVVSNGRLSLVKEADCEVEDGQSE